MPIKLFTNFLTYRLSQPLHPSDPEALSEALSQKPARPLGSQELSCMGFIEPMDTEGEYAELIRPGMVFISARKSERLLPGKVVRQAVDAKVREIEEDQMRKVYAKEKARIKDEVVQTMLPRAFVTHSRINALLAPPYLFVETSSAKKADELLSLLREAIGTLPVRPVATQVSPIETFTDWVLHGGDTVPHPFALGESFQSRGASEESQTLSGKNVDLSLSDITQLIEAGRRVNQLELQSEDHTGAMTVFTVNEMLGIRGVQWPEDLMAEIEKELGEEGNHIEVLRATLLLLGNQISHLLARLLHALGGEEIPVEGGAAGDTLSGDEDDEEELL